MRRLGDPTLDRIWHLSTRMRRRRMRTGSLPCYRRCSPALAAAGTRLGVTRDRWKGIHPLATGICGTGEKDALISPHARDSVRPLAVTQIVTGMAVYRNLHALGAGMGNGFMTCKTKDQELVVPGIARIE